MIMDAQRYAVKDSHYKWSDRIIIELPITSRISTSVSQE